MSPYYDEDGVRIYCGDSRLLIAGIEADAIITDPVWPNCARVFAGIEPQPLLSEVLERATWCHRVVVQLGCGSDVRFLGVVPQRLPFIRVCYLQYVPCGYLGRILNDADVAYAFGTMPPRTPGMAVVPGTVIAASGDPADRPKGFSRNRKKDEVAQLAGDPDAHPAPRKLKHVRWLCKWFGGSSVCDPFMGSGTTAVACRALGIPFVGIEINERYCEIAVERLRQHRLAFMGEPAPAAAC